MQSLAVLATKPLLLLALTYAGLAPETAHIGKSQGCSLLQIDVRGVVRAIASEVGLEGQSLITKHMQLGDGASPNSTSNASNATEDAGQDVNASTGQDVNASAATADAGQSVNTRASGEDAGHAADTTATTEDPGPQVSSVPLAESVRHTARSGVNHHLATSGWKMLVELHVPVRLRKLHTGPQGPIKKFLATLKQELASAGFMSPARLVILDVRGENKNFSFRALDLMELELLDMDPLRLPQESAEGLMQEEAVPLRNAKDKKETIVDVEVLPTEDAGALPPGQLLSLWRSKLADAESTLRQGPLGAYLQGATLDRVGPPLTADGSGNAWGAFVRSGAQARTHCRRGLLLGVLLAPLVLLSAN
mmetsp:Transcript_115996/g.323060  ORF Transcript_115996/g.323060 Transcript_115996/m.323060 type:complete len:364 (+) Transcript_115996:160-1251(+)